MSNKNKNLKILGRIVDRQTQKPVEGLRVEAWDKDLIHDEVVGSSLTDAEGAFQIEVEESSFRGIFPERRPDLFFRVLRDGDILRTTEDSILWNVTEAPPEILIEVNSGLSTSQRLEVSGNVKLADGGPARGVLIGAFDCDLRNDQRLGSTRSGTDGSYSIHYSPSQFEKPESGSADLVVKVFSDARTVLASSQVVFNAPASAQIDVTIPRTAIEPPSLFDRIQTAVGPNLRRLTVADLEENDEHQDLSFLSGETSLEFSVLARFVLAHRLAAQGMSPIFWFALTGGTLLQRTQDRTLDGQLQFVLDSLPTFDATTVRKKLLSSISEAEIPSAAREKIDEWVEEFRQVVGRHLLSAQAAPFIKEALADAGVTAAAKQETFARLFAEHRGNTAELVQALKNAKFKAQEIADLQTSIDITDLTQSDISVVKAIKHEFGVRKPEDIRSLARRSEDEWIKLIKTRQAAGDITLPVKIEGLDRVKPPDAELFGKTLARQFHEAFPTAAFAGGLDRALNNGGLRGLKRGADLGRFLEAHDDFDLLRTHADKFLKEHPQSREITADDEFRTELKSAQRVFKLAPNFEATDSVLADNIHSAQQIYRMGRSEFVRRYKDAPGFTADLARVVWNRAAETHATALTIVGDLKAWQAEGLPQVLLNDTEAALKKFPNWDNLFQAGDLCECEHCRSVLGPAAYFADLLVFLRDRNAKPGKRVKEVLFPRRPDLGYLELNCDNALTPLPYVDVVCEVLESVIANGEADVEIIGLTTIPDATAATRAAVATALENQGIIIADGFTLSQVDTSDPNRWIVHGDNITYLLKKKATPNFFAEILRNTKTTAEELRAYPQYVNAKAYEKLRQARFPFALPFDLFAEEVRSALLKTNLQRWDLMDTFRGPAAPNNPTDGDIAAVYFKIGVDGTAPFDEKRLILVADATLGGQQAVWGELGNPALLTKVSNVKQFLLKTGLEYNDLLALLDLKFINPGGDIVVHHQDSSCDTDKKDLQNLDLARLDSIHRFLRLWRKLGGWKMWELDLVIRHPAIGGKALDENFLINLMHLAELNKRLGSKSSVERVLALFGNVNAGTRFTELHKPRADALYQTTFLNRRLSNPIDDALKIDSGTGDLAPGQTISGHDSVVLAALGIRQTDRELFQGLTKVSDGTPYVNDDLNLANLSFLYRHSWMSKLLKFKSDEWRVLLKLVAQEVPTFASLAAQQAFLEQKYFIKAVGLSQVQVDQLLQQVFHRDVLQFASAKSAREFVEKIDRLKDTGFKADELSWMLAADRDAKAAMKETDAARFLLGLRTQLQQIQAAHDPAQFDFLTVAVPTDADQLNALLGTLLQQLNRTEDELNLAQRTLLGAVELETGVQGLPLGFAFPAVITGVPNNIPIAYQEPNLKLVFHGMMTDAQRSVLLNDPSLAGVSGDAPYSNAIDELFQLSQAAPAQFASVEIDVVIPGGITLPATLPSLPIRYDATRQKLSFTGLMSNAERLALIAVPGNPAGPIQELFDTPRMAVKFFEPIFTSALPHLPAAIDLKTQLTPELAAKIEYDAEKRLLRFKGIMRQSEQTELTALAPNVLPEEIAYHNAINDLFAQPQAVVPPDERIWLTDTELDSSIPANDTLAKRLASAIFKALDYLSRTLVAKEIVQESSAILGLTEAVTDQLFRHYEILPVPPAPPNSSLLAYFAGDFTTTSGALDYASAKIAFDAWFWANRVATIWKKWKLSLEEWERLIKITSGAKVLDFTLLPLDSAAPALAVDQFIRLTRLMKLRDTLPEASITLLEILEKLDGGAYGLATDFAADVELTNENWLATDVNDLVAGLNLTFPGDYLLAENWERMRRAFYFVDNLNAGPATVKTFAAPAMGQADARRLNDLLRSKFGSDTWFVLSPEIQDVLRERKRDALAAYLLTQPMPTDAPTKKWENSNDIYAYYLLDVEMCSCMLTSRMVQASGSVQLFVQRCFMGLEPQVTVVAHGDDGDSAWDWWKWMSKYRVWEANRKVFLWPENWIEPQLLTTKSQFFQDLENELLQNDVTQDSAEIAVQNYLLKLDGVAQLEVAGFYQEDDADETIIHVFGRTKGAEPHTYYYRRFDYRQWTPWEKIELDIEGDYLVPAVVNHRLFLFWPIFKEVAAPTDGTVKVPKMSLNNDSDFTVKKTEKILRMYMAVSDYRNGQWSAKKVSKSFAQSFSYSVELEKKFYRFHPVDRSDLDGRFGVAFIGASLGSDGNNTAGLGGAFEIAGCTGAPEQADDLLETFVPTVRPESASAGPVTSYLKWVELQARTDAPENDFTLEFFNSNANLVKVLVQTPWSYFMTPPWHLSYFDRLVLNGLSLFTSIPGIRDQRRLPMPYGTWLPYFYNDKKRTFFVLPSFAFPRKQAPEGLKPRLYYPDVKDIVRKWENFFAGQIRKWAETFVPALAAAQRTAAESFLQIQLSLQSFPPYTDEQLVDFLVRYFMKFFQWYLGLLAFFALPGKEFDFKNFYHPFVCDFIRMVFNPNLGIPEMMSRQTQLRNSGFRFKQDYQPTGAVVQLGTEEFYPEEIVDFSPDGSYSPYNWELFYHVPLLIGNLLSQNQRFEEARDWYHHIFNPIGLDSPTPGGSPLMSKYWITKPFFKTTDTQYIQQRIENIMLILAGDTSVPGASALKKALEQQVKDWRTYPFEPHRIANYRTVAYQKTVVMKYLDNLIAWGDYLFRQDSMESINEATQLYVLAAEILGPRPMKVPPQVKPPVETYNELEKTFDAFSNALVEVENVVPPMPGGDPGPDPAPLPMLYFCIPQNEKLLSYWDTVADRLYKIRHCMNIEGVVRQLALFEPPIDPGALVKAVAGGIDLSSALADLNAPLPLYRFTSILQRAKEVCNDVRSLGGLLLAALEKKDGEALALLRQTQEIDLLNAVKAVREKQLDEAKENLEVLNRARITTEVRRDYYRDIERISAGEQLNLDKLEIAQQHSQTAQNINIGASVMGYIPNVTIGGSGFGGSPHVNVQWGTGNIISAIQAAAGAEHLLSGMASYEANRAATSASHDRRFSDWKLQEKLADRELDHLDKQIDSAKTRITIAEQELENQKLQIENAKATDEFMRSKYTNKDLYQWQIGQISNTYFRSYKLAYDLAKRAERCFRFELGLQDSSYINFGYWDSLKKGLLSGEQLQHDLHRMENAMLELNRREFEITKHVSLSLLDPLALVKLRETGKCFFRVPEELFDLDFPGHYFRRIRSVSLTLPCIVGPYTTVSCTVRLLKNSIRVNTTNGDNGYPHNVDDQGLPADDLRFIENNIQVKAIAASNGQNDSGVFELAFRDERYLPFEGAGAISDWMLELFNDLPANNPDPVAPDFGKPLRQFDYSTISDAVLTIKYTSREDAGPFKNGAIKHLRDYFAEDGTTPSLRLFNLRQEFPGHWHRFLNPINVAAGNVFEFEMGNGLFPLKDGDKTLKINTVWLLARCTRPDAYTVVIDPPLPPPPPAGSNTMKLARVNQYGGLHFARKDVSVFGIEVDPSAPPLTWKLKMTPPGGGNLQIDATTGEMEVEDLMLAVGYEWEP